MTLTLDIEMEKGGGGIAGVRLDMWPPYCVVLAYM